MFLAVTVVEWIFQNMLVANPSYARCWHRSAAVSHQGFKSKLKLVCSDCSWNLPQDQKLNLVCSDCSRTPQDQKLNLVCSDYSQTPQDQDLNLVCSDWSWTPPGSELELGLQWLQSDPPPPGSELELGLQWLQSNPPPPQDQKLKLEGYPMWLQLSNFKYID